jgi:hypothetical protein
MLVSELQAVHERYGANEGEWRFLLASYEGARALKDLGYIKKHERESSDNYDRRLDDLYGFAYTRSVINLYTHYLFKRDVKRKVPKSLENDTLWRLFLGDCDLFGQAFDEFLPEQSRYGGVYGHMGILVDKSTASVETEAAAAKYKVYPYLAAYHPTAILDWQYVRDIYNRPQLAYLKLRDDDGLYRLWWRDHWQVWKEPPDDEDASSTEPSDKDAELVMEGPNTLGEIPFVWLWNVLTKDWPIGYSDVHEIARIDLSLIRNASQGEEVINLGAFPMMRKPMIERHTATQDLTGASAILEFDPENPAAKPDWLPAEVRAPIQAIQEWIERKVGEIYRAANAGGMASMEISTAAKSGAALQAEFQLLNATLVQKAKNLEKAEMSIIEYWLKWQGKPELFDEVSIERSRNYDVENLAQDLENALTSGSIVRSRRFLAEIQKRVARQMLPSIDDDTLLDIDKEIDAAPEHELHPRRAAELNYAVDEELNRERKQAEIEARKAGPGAAE